MTTDLSQLSLVVPGDVVRDGQRYFLVREASGQDAIQCVARAITWARVTGSVGASEHIVGSDGVESIGTVVELVERRPHGAR